MKTIQIIDGAENCADDCFSADEELFSAIFPGEEQNVEFTEDFVARNPNGQFDSLFTAMWKRPIAKKKCQRN